MHLRGILDQTLGVTSATPANSDIRKLFESQVPNLVRRDQRLHKLRLDKLNPPEPTAPAHLQNAAEGLWLRTDLAKRIQRQVLGYERA
jgi:hypothetical protein